MKEFLSGLDAAVHLEALGGVLAAIALIYVFVRTPKRRQLRFAALVLGLLALAASSALALVARGLPADGIFDLASSRHALAVGVLRFGVGLPLVLLVAARDSTAARRRRRLLEKGPKGAMPRLSDVGPAVDEVVRLEDRSQKAEKLLETTRAELAGKAAETARIESKMRETLNLMLSTEEKFRSLFDRANDGFVEADIRSRRITRANPGMAALTGISVSELVGSELAEVFGEEFKDGDLITLAENSQAGKLPPFTILRRDGEKVRVQSSFAVIASGEKPALFGLARDITEGERLRTALGAQSKTLEQAERRLGDAESEVSDRREMMKLLNDRLRELKEVRDRFFGVVADRLNKPELSLRSFSEILLRFSEADDAKKHELITLVNRESEKFRSLIDEVLAVVRTSGGKQGCVMGEVRIADLVDEVLASESVPAGDRGVRIEVDVPGDLPPIAGDRERLRDLLTDLVRTSVLFGRSGSTVRVHVGRAQKGSLETVVENLGPGVAQRELQKVFDAFRKPEPPDQGLEGCKKTIDAHGGRLWVRSAPGCGSAFHFTLKPMGIEKAETGAAEPEDQGERALPPLPRRKGPAPAPASERGRAALPPMRETGTRTL